MKTARICALLAALAILPGCGSPAPIGQTAEAQATAAAPSVAPGEELMASCASREEAEALASLYGVELVRYDYGVASFHTTEDPAAVIRRGEEKGWPPLEFNGIVTINH